MTSRITTLQYHFDAPPSTVYQALLNENLLSQWKVPDEMDCTIHEFHAVEGGRLRISLSYNNPDEKGKSTGNTDTYYGLFTRLIPYKEIVEVDEFETKDSAMQGKMTITYRLEEEGEGTDLLIIHEGLPSGVSLQDNEIGWRMALEKLADLL